MERQQDAVSFFEKRLDSLSLDRVSRDVTRLAQLLASLDAGRRTIAPREDALGLAR